MFWILIFSELYQLKELKNRLDIYQYLGYVEGKISKCCRRNRWTTVKFDKTKTHTKNFQLICNETIVKLCIVI
jgi:hypothetical protein